MSRYEAAARVRIAALKSESVSDPGAVSRRLRAARSRTHGKAEKAKSEPKASITDSQARRMRFADGGVGAACNLQFAVSTDSHVIVGVRETARRNDAGPAGEMVEQLERRYGCRPDRLLADTRYATRKDLPGPGEKGVEVYMPPPSEKSDAKVESVRRRVRRPVCEPALLQAWRGRMASDAGRAAYRRRLRVEAVNGAVKGRGLGRLLVRGLAKVSAAALLHAVAHNLWRAHRLACEA